MNGIVTIGLVVSAAVSVMVGAAFASKSLNAALSTQSDVLALSTRGQHAAAAATGHRYFSQKRREALSADECMLLTTIAYEELRAGEKAAGLRTLDGFDRDCGGKPGSMYAAYADYAQLLRRALNGESLAELDSLYRQSRPTQDTSDRLMFVR